jgi:hypothetical protein
MKRQLILVLALCLTITTPSLAAFSLGYDELPVDVGDGLWSYQIYITGTSPGGGLAAAFDSVNVSGEIVQFSMGSATSGTVLDTDIIDNPGTDQAYLAKDTHLITPAGGWTNIVGGATEWNDGSISTVNGGVWNAPHILGLGGITSTSADAYGFETQAGDIHFLQLVLDRYYAEISVHVFGTDGTGNPAGLMFYPPEPSTIAMLIFGGLSLLFVRRKR